MILHFGRLLLPVVAHAPVVGSIYVVEWVVGSGLSIAPVHLAPRVLTPCVVEDDIKNHGDTALVALVDERLVHCARAVVFVGGKIEVGIVAPRVVAVKLLDRHKLNGVHAKFREVVELFHCALKALLLGEVAQKQLIDDEVVLCRSLEVGHLPLITVAIALEHGDRECAHLLGREGFKVGITGVSLVDPLVVPGVENELGARVGNHDFVIDDEIVAILLVHVELSGRQSEPEVFVALIIHHAGVLHAIVVPFTHENHIALFGRIEAESDASVGILVGTLKQCARVVGGNRVGAVAD